MSEVLFESMVKKRIKSYETKNGLRWKFVLPDGKGFQIREQGFLTQGEAKIRAAKLYSEMLLKKEKHTEFIGSNLTFSQYSKIWLQQKQNDGIRETTFRRYEDIIEVFLKPYFGNFELAKIEKRHLRNYVDEIRTEGVSTYNQNSSVSVLKTIFKRAIEDDYIPMSNILTFRVPKHVPKDPLFWDISEIDFFLNATQGSKYQHYWKFVLYTGVRASELAGLKWDCVHLNRHSGGQVGFIEIKRTCAQKTRKIHESTKNGDKRMIPMFPEVRELLQNLKNNSEGDFVFGGKEPIETSHMSRLFRQEVRKYPYLKQITFHGLRHSFCSFLDAKGMNRRIVSEIMGHRDLNTTNRYSHVSNQTLGLEFSRFNQELRQQKTNNLQIVGF